MSVFVTLLGLFVVWLIYKEIMGVIDSLPKSDSHTVEKVERETIVIDYNEEDDDEDENEDEDEEKSLDKVVKDNSEVPDLVLFQLYVSKILEEDPSYIQKSYYNLRVCDNESSILSTVNVFVDVSPQLLCLKLIHSISMVRAFTDNFVKKSDASIYNLSSRKKDLFLKLFVGANSVDIDEKSGFGFIGYNVDDMAYALDSYYYAMRDYIKELSKNENYSFLKRVVSEFDDGLLRKADPNVAVILFINNNKDFYKDDIKYVKSILKK